MDASERVYNAAVSGDTQSLAEVLQDDKFILDRCMSEGRYTKSPLHVAVNAGHLAFTEELLSQKPELAEEVDQVKMWSPLHKASARGHLEIVKKLMSVSPSMCLARDQDGLTPIHVAAARGHVSVLEELHQKNRYAAQERTNNGESVLHLCVKHSQLEALKSLLRLTEGDGDQLINSKDNNGNTILHLAVTCNQLEMVKYLLVDCKTRIEVDAVNNKDMTVLDVYKKQSKKLRDKEMKKYLNLANANGAKDTLDHQSERLEHQRSALMVVASLIATMAFQAGMNPPGGVYQETKKGDHEAGFAIWPYYYDNYYNIALISNTVAFVSSISVITLLISGLPFKQEWLINILRVTLWIATVATSVTYAFVLTYVTRINDPPLNYALKSSYGVWVYVMVFILSANVTGFLWRRKAPIVRYFRNCFNVNLRNWVQLKWFSTPPPPPGRGRTAALNSSIIP